ncbi:MAG: helix-turn-helix domain-containing protein [Aureispira sp.]
MSGKSNLEIKESGEELKKLRKRQTSLKYEKRVVALERIREKKDRTYQDLADYLGVKKRTLESWMTAYRRKGIEELLRVKPRRQGSVLLTSEIEEALSARLKDPKGGFSSYKEACNWVNATYGIGIQYNTLRVHLMKHFGTKLKSPRKSHVSKDPEAAAQFLKNSQKD